MNAGSLGCLKLCGSNVPTSKELSNHNEACEQCQPLQGLSRKYSHTHELINNLPYIAMIVLGTAIFVVGFDSLLWRWIAASTYLIYGVTGVFWIIVFMCPFCRYYDTRSCPCGYGSIAARFRKKQPAHRFDEKFRQHIPVIVPLWFIPIVIGIPLAVSSFSMTLLALLVAFAVDSFVILPLVSTKHGCKDCPQRDSCPWMRRKAKQA